MDSPAVKGVAIATTNNDAYGQVQQEGSKEEERNPQYEGYEQMEQGGEEKSPQYEVVCSPTECSPVTRYALPPVPSPLDPPTEGGDEAVYEPIPGDK